MKKNKKYTAYVCSHTHWDREWYATFEQFRIRLTRLLDKLLEILRTDREYKHFNLDGQTIVLEDYLEIKPEKEALLRKYTGNGRITVGPWYVLPDEFCVSGEAIIRNLLRGNKIAEQFGRCSKVGYLPDMFGHISQMPQILRGFGIDNAIIWRGLSGDEYKHELWWHSPDGSKVLTYHIEQYCGYCNAALFSGSLPEHLRNKYTEDFYMLTRQPLEAAKALEEIAIVSARKATTPILLLLNGVDHMEPQPELPAILKTANRVAKNTRFIHSTLDDFIKAFRKHSSASFQSITGEIRDTVWTKEGGNIVLPNTLSSRVYLKIQNHRCQTLLERYAEPTSVWAMKLGFGYPSGLLERAWKYLLQNHPHDSICGCSLDEVHQHMESRFESCQEIAESITEENLYKISKEIDASMVKRYELAPVVFNPLNWEINDTVTLQIDIPESWFQTQGISPDRKNLKKLFAAFYLVDLKNRNVPFQVIDVEKLTANYNYLSEIAPLHRIVRLRAKVNVKVPQLGYTIYRLGLKKTKSARYHRVVKNENTIENKYISVKVNPDGSFNLHDKSSGARYKNLGSFEDGGDNGDGYTYSYPLRDTIYSSLKEKAQVKVLENGETVQAIQTELNWRLPVSLKENRQERALSRKILKISSTITLGKRSKRVDIKTKIYNNIKDHRLRVVFPTYLNTDTCWSENQFDIRERPIRIKQPPREVWKEDQPREYPQQSFCSVSDGKSGLAVANRGLLEFGVSDDKKRAIRITLLRAVKWLGAGEELNTLQGGAGPNIQTPDSQCQRELTFHYSVIPHSGKRWHYHVQKQAHEHSVDFLTHTITRQQKGSLPPEFSFLKVEGGNIIISSIKQAEDKNGIILRLWNSGSETSTAKISSPHAIRKAYIVDLLEKNKRKLKLRHSAVTFKIGKKEILTLRIQ